MTTIGVTGVTGHLGRLVAEQLLARGGDEALVGAARSPEKAADLAARGIDVRAGDYSRPETLTAAFAGVDVLVFVSGTEVGKRVAQHANVVEAAKAAGVGRVIYTSAPRADTTQLVMAPDHKATEEMLRACGVPWTILRNNWYIENYTPQLGRYLTDGAIVSAAGGGRIHGATRADFAAAIVAVATTDGHEGRVYELGGAPFTMDDLARTITELTGTQVTHRAVSTGELVAGLTASGLDAGTAGFVAAIDESVARGDLEIEGDDLARLIGRPPTSLADAVHEAHLKS